MGQDNNFLVGRGLPSYSPDAIAQVQPRMGRFREQYALNLGKDIVHLADEGTYFNAVNPTLGTPIAQTTSITAFGATTPVLIIQNTDSPTNLGYKRIYLDYIRLIQGSTVPTSATAWQSALILDKGPRYTSGGTALTPVNPNMDLAALSIAAGFFGAIVAPAALSARVVGRHVARSVIPVVNDETIYSFGNDHAPGAVSDIAGTTAKRLVIPCGPVVIGPGQVLLLYQWGPSCAAAPTFEFELGWWER